MGQALEKPLVMVAENLFGEGRKFRDKRLDIEEDVFGRINFRLRIREFLLLEEFKADGDYGLAGLYQHLLNPGEY
jgi:hypothetical protein